MINALSATLVHDQSLDPEESPSEESQVSLHRELRKGKFYDAASHRICLTLLTLVSMRRSALNCILVAIMVGDREQATDIAATVEAFLSAQSKYKVRTHFVRPALTTDRIQ